MAWLKPVRIHKIFILFEYTFMHIMCEISLHENYHSISNAFQYVICGNQLMIKAIKIPQKRVEYDMGFEFIALRFFF